MYVIAHDITPRWWLLLLHAIIIHARMCWCCWCCSWCTSNATCVGVCTRTRDLYAHARCVWGVARALKISSCYNIGSICGAQRSLSSVAVRRAYNWGDKERNCNDLRSCVCVCESEGGEVVFASNGVHIICCRRLSVCVRSPVCKLVFISAASIKFRTHSLTHVRVGVCACARTHTLSRANT